MMTAGTRRRKARIVEPPLERFASPASPVPAEVASTEAPWQEHPVDRATYALIAKVSGGFSPMGLTEAWFDWAIHLGVTPARQWQIGWSAVQAAAKLAALPGRGAHIPNPMRTPAAGSTVSDPAWQQWPFALQAEAHLAAERWMRRPGMCMGPAGIIWRFSIWSAASSSTSSRPRTSLPLIPRYSGRPSRPAV